MTRAGAGRLQAVFRGRPQTLSAGERRSRCPGSVRRRSGLHCWQDKRGRSSRLRSCGVARALRIRIPWLGRRLHSIEGWRTGELGGNTLPSEPEDWQRAMPCAWGKPESESAGSLKTIASPASSLRRRAGSNRPQPGNGVDLERLEKRATRGARDRAPNEKGLSRERERQIRSGPSQPDLTR